MAKRKIDVRKPKSELREGFETMVYYHVEGAKNETYRYLFKGRVVKFKVAEAKTQTLDGVYGRLFTIIADSPKAYVWYEAFQRASDGVVFFLGESETQSVDKSQRNREMAYLNRFN